MHVCQTLVSSALTGIAVGLAFALPILIIATHNFIVGLMATINIVCITVTVIGFIPLMGWKLGVSGSDVTLSNRCSHIDSSFIKCIYVPKVFAAVFS